MARFDLTDEEWAIIAPHLPKQGRGPERKDDRKVLTGFFYILRTGHHGATCWTATIREQRSITVTIAGVSGVSGEGFSKRYSVPH